MNTERELFEAAVERELNYGYDLMKDFEGNYPHDATDSMWVMWQAARTQPTPPNQWQKPETKPPLDARMKRSAVCYIAKLDGTVAQAIYDPYYDREFSDGRGGLVRWPGWIEILPSACHTGQYMEEPIVAWMSIQEVPAHPLSAELGEFADSSAQVIATPPAQPAPVVPEGHKLVPIEPTQAMLDAVVSTVDEMLLGQAAERQYREDWAAMLAAAPQPLPLHNVELSGHQRPARKDEK